MADNSESFIQEEEYNPEALKWLQDTELLDTSSARWIDAMRATGYERFATTGFPRNSWEDWKYANLRSLSKGNFQFSLSDDAEVAEDKIPQALLTESYKLVVVNGRFKKELSLLPHEVEVFDLMHAAKKSLEGIEQYLVTVGDLSKEPFKALNAAYMQEGIVLKVKSDCLIEKPIEILFYHSGKLQAFYPRYLYWLGKGSSATIIERHIDADSCFVNSYHCIVEEQDSKLRLYKMGEESADATVVSSLMVQQHKNSSLEYFNYSTGGKFKRDEYRSELLDKDIENNISGVYLVRGEQNYDLKVLASHFEPQGTSEQYFKGVVDGSAQASFQGKVHVNRNAQKTKASQLSKAILLSKKARVNFKPELEIYADDVKCSHGASSGHIDEAALFYLKSRGIAEDEARVLLIEAFLQEALERITFEPIKEIYREKIEKWLLTK